MRSLLPPLMLPSLFAALLGSVVLLACQTDSETPNAYFGRDGGPGDVGQLCRGGNQCNEIELVCVDDDGESGPAPPTCRDGCQVAQNDPCGAAFLCVAIGGGPDGACVPAAALGEPCTGRCDDGLECIEDPATPGSGTCQADAGGEGEGEGEGE